MGPPCQNLTRSYNKSLFDLLDRSSEPGKKHLPRKRLTLGGSGLFLKTPVD